MLYEYYLEIKLLISTELEYIAWIPSALICTNEKQDYLKS
jgi:hypothetical protein